ncbi:hypothetical protein GCM10010532_083300 [Dactylosporangium siamense]|uniref:Uncharacterized protein n=1 Tax=Dactylosporangium siamense TaxID=685454 RepID=A0A919PPD6_9ACTN|nr:hypothetical protein Dsi01nite_063270 [Dactylosporangium siamense]
MPGLGDPFQEVPVDELAGEAHLHPYAGPGGGVGGGRHEVVERPVEVWQGHVDADPRDRQVRGGLAGWGRLRGAGLPGGLRASRDPFRGGLSRGLCGIAPGGFLPDRIQRWEETVL